jgi:hypothetical protein
MKMRNRDYALILCIFIGVIAAVILIACILSNHPSKNLHSDNAIAGTVFDVYNRPRELIMAYKTMGYRDGHKLKPALVRVYGDGKDFQKDQPGYVICAPVISISSKTITAIFSKMHGCTVSVILIEPFTAEDYGKTLEEIPW